MSAEAMWGVSMLMLLGMGALILWDRREWKKATRKDKKE
jgi:uncharacterized iron-regulated membrane protein